MLDFKISKINAIENGEKCLSATCSDYMQTILLNNFISCILSKG